MLLRPVRFADGQLARFRDDFVAMLLKIGEMVLLVAGLVWWLTDSFNQYVALLLIMSFAVSFAASWRLRFIVCRAEKVRQAERDRGVVETLASSQTIFKRIDDCYKRFMDWCIRHDSRKAESLLALAENADDCGDESAAVKYRKRAAKYRAAANKYRELKAK